MSDMQAMAGAAWDSHALDQLKREVSSDPKGKALQVAKQVEGMFVQMMMKSMREALPKGGMLDNDQTRLYSSMWDQQIAQQIGNRGLGLADTIVKQMMPAEAPSETAGTVPMKLDGDYIVSHNMASMELEQMVRKAVPRLPAGGSALPVDSQAFIAQLTQPAQQASAQSGIPHHLILAQAALESGWGQRQIMTRDGKPSYNLFGVKASADWQGATTDVTTTEYEHGIAKKVRATFRVYGSYLEALSDYVKLLGNNPRYAAVTNARSAEQGAQALQAAGYATDPNYAQKLVGMIQQFKNMGDKAVKAYSHDLSNLF